MAFDADKSTGWSWHRGGAACAATPVAAVRGLGSTCPSTPCGSAAPRDLNVAPVQGAQITS